MGIGPSENPLSRGLRVYRSNRMEALVDALGDVLSTPLANPLSPECILVPGRGVAQWLSMRLCQRFGVWANPLYLFPRNFTTWALERVLGSRDEAVETLDRDRLIWVLFGTLRPELGRPEFEALRRYVQGDPNGVRYFDLCERIAFTFDRYAIYRPELLESWERGANLREKTNEEAPQLRLFAKPDDTQRWQPILWRALRAHPGTAHLGALERRFLRSLDKARRLSNLPARICSLGITHLPPSYTRILVALGAHVPVHLFQLEATERRAGDDSLEAARPSRSVPSELARTHNPLLASLGVLAGDFERVLSAELTRQEVAADSVALFQLPEGGSLLSQLQREISTDRAAAPAAALSAVSNDESIRIHDCHSPMREVEVLHAQLIDLLAKPKGIEPRDVIVMMPDVEVYAPLIEAVFQRGRNDPQRIPYSIADRSAERAAPVIDALERLFELADQRLTVSQVSDLLAREVIAQRFDISPREVEQMTRWLGQTNVRWGIDAEHRKLHGHPPALANTWRLGLERLLLGYAVHQPTPELLGEMLPAPSAEGIEALALGKLAEFVDTLFRQLGELGRAHPAAAWPAVVTEALEALSVNDADNAWQHQSVRDALTGLSEHAARAAYAEPVCSRAFARLLFDAVNAARAGSGFMVGGVTFCSMVPLRTIPFRVVCMMGLSDGEFPRHDVTTDFDLIASDPQGPRLGDRSARNEDRYLFLEAILSARERLIITYTGQSIRDNSALPPSVVLRELLDYLERYRPHGHADQPWLVRHPLQPFSPRYFDRSDPRLFSYESRPLTSQRPGPSGAAAPNFFPEPLPPPIRAPIALAELTRFFANPTAHLLERRLDLFLKDFTQELPDREPQELSPLEVFTAGDELLALILRDTPLDKAMRLVAAGGTLPLGAPGELAFLEISASALPIAECVRRAKARGPRPRLLVDAKLPTGRRVFGSLTDLFGPGVLHHQFARVRAKQLLSLWIQHLVFCWLSPAEAEAKSTLIGRPEKDTGRRVVEFRRVAEPAQHLETLVKRYDQGQALPLALFPTTSLLYAELVRNQKVDRGVEGQLQKSWEQELSEDVRLTRVFGSGTLLEEVRPLGAGHAGFEELALETFEPLLEHCSEPEEDT